MRDYSERRQSRTTAPPKRPPVWPYVLLIVFLVLIAFMSGLGTGWYLYRPGGRFYKAPQVSQPAAAPKPETTVPSQGQPITPAAAQTPAQGQSAPDKSIAAPPLTFYNTLQKGNKGLMGTGINEPKEPQQQNPAKSTSTTQQER